MTTVTTTPTTPGPVPAEAARRLGVTQARVLRSEWTKFRSLRSTVITLTVAIALTVGLGLLFAAVSAHNWNTFAPDEKATFDPTGVTLGGFTFSQLALGVLGILLITGEYSTGMIRASLTAVPQRLPVLWGKVGVFVGVVFPLAFAGALVVFLGGQALLSSTGISVGLGAPGALRSVAGAALYVTLAGVIAMGLGAVLRNTAAAIATFVGIFFVLPPLTDLLPKHWTGFVPYLPSEAGGSLWGMSTGGNATLSPGVGLGVLCGYTVAIVAVAAWRFRRSDA